MDPDPGDPRCQAEILGLELGYRMSHREARAPREPRVARIRGSPFFT